MRRFVKAVSGMHYTVIYTDTDGRHFRFSGGTWTWRNHNPGNVRPGYYADLHNPIGVTHNFAIFADDKSGHATLLDLLMEKYGNYSIHRMIYEFAPPSENPTKKYERYLHETIGIWDDTKIKNFTKTQFEKLWKAIQHFEDYKVGKIVEVHRISDVEKIGKNEYRFCREDGDWMSEKECIRYAKQAQVELEVCISDSGTEFLRACPNSQFQKTLKSLMHK